MLLEIIVLSLESKNEAFVADLTRDEFNIKRVVCLRHNSVIH
jgi:hypothetical protein